MEPSTRGGISARGSDPEAPGPGECQPVELRNAAGASPFVLVCEHAGREIPARLGDRMPAPADLDRHIAWDVGAGDLARSLSDRLDAVLVAQRYSRLVIDCNRPAWSAELAPAVSDGTRIEFNRSLADAEIRRRWEAIHQPFRRAVAAALDRRQRPLLVSLHSFAPRLSGGPPRRVEVGLLSRRAPSLAPALAAALGRLAPGLVVRCNEPYRIETDSDYTIPVHAEARALPHVLLEIRSDLIAGAAARRHWTSLLAAALAAAAAAGQDSAFALGAQPELEGGDG